MLTLRILALASNLCFIVYALSEELTPILLLHGALLPLNLVRLAQMKRMPDRAKRALADRDDDFRWLAEVGRSRRIAAGETLFRRGEPARSMFVVESGRVRVEEFGRDLGPGELFGEIGLFADDGRRTATVRAMEPTRLSEITDSRFRRLHYDNPRFSYQLTRLITRRLLANVQEDDVARHCEGR
jgi:CRP-like cAMP-binding protein